MSAEPTETTSLHTNLERYHYVECPDLGVGVIYDIENEDAWIESSYVVVLEDDEKG